MLRQFQKMILHSKQEKKLIKVLDDLILGLLYLNLSIQTQLF